MIGYVHCEWIIYDSFSLKDKRSVMKRILTRVKQQYNAAVSELDYQDSWQRAKIGIVSISSDKTHTEKELNRVLAFIDSFPEIERTVTVFEWL
ncbi:DUF503 family protein [Bacillus sp. FJAT-42376]|uniref:DUF503 domain-containing protein n=1 Tax=Bacillus sp. FJAT-42376 TaxID=2014076 RepID=UPI000F4D58DF|nr:DUF503 family protein [Bacillus sp. FJAT-42376]AZB42980.1 DUF503 family protein [Bacillus sp. FJAT-42376]